MAKGASGQENSSIFSSMKESWVRRVEVVLRVLAANREREFEGGGAFGEGGANMAFSVLARWFIVSHILSWAKRSWLRHMFSDLNILFIVLRVNKYRF